MNNTAVSREQTGVVVFRQTFIQEQSHIADGLSIFFAVTLDELEFSCPKRGQSFVVVLTKLKIIHQQKGKT
jgi:hypothetical protein